MTEYSRRIKSHLASYKLSQLGVEEHGQWRGNGRAYAHVLPESRQDLNILPHIRQPFWRYYEAHLGSLPLHTDFHHLNSSQALTFNLFFSWVGMSADDAVLLRALGAHGRRVVSWAFESMPDEAERTSVDLLGKFADGGRLLIEVKFTEANFGQCVPDAAHQAKLRETYRPKLQGKCRAESFDEGQFYLNYQLYRNLSHLDLARRDVLFLILPRANTFTWAAAQAFREDCVGDVAKTRVHVCALEDLLAGLRQATSPDGPLSAHLAEIEHKYLPGAP